MSSVDTRSSTSLFTVVLVTDATATCQAFALQVAGETFCAPEPQAIAALLARRPADLVVLALGGEPSDELRQHLQGHNVVSLAGASEASASVRLALETGDPAGLLKALAAALCTLPPPVPAPPELPQPDGGDDAPAVADSATADAPAVANEPTPPPPSTQQAQHARSAAVTELEERLERVLNRRLAP